MSALRSPLPGFGLTLGITLAWLAWVVLIPIGALLLKAAGMGPAEFAAVAFSPRALAAYRLSFGTAALAAIANAVIGLLVAWVLVRYPFPLKRFCSALVDLPFALPTAVAGIALTALYAPGGWLGQPLGLLGVQIAYTPTGIVLALMFVGLPFVVRTVEPVLADLGSEPEEAAATLGAGRARTFLRVTLPAITPALVTGTGLAFARGVGEYGSVIFIAGNMPGRTEIAPLLVVTQLEQYAYEAATAIAVVMMATSFTVLLALNAWQVRRRRRLGE